LLQISAPAPVLPHLLLQESDDIQWRDIHCVNNTPARVESPDYVPSSPSYVPPSPAISPAADEENFIHRPLVLPHLLLQPSHVDEYEREIAGLRRRI